MSFETHKTNFESALERQEKCQLCGIVPRHIDHCGEFGNCYCPYFGVKGDEVEKHMKERGLKSEK